jgi:hypothetical protein
MELIFPPSDSRRGARRLDKCRTALAPAFKELTERAAASGWQEPEIALALADLAEAHVEVLARSLDMRVVTTHRRSDQLKVNGTVAAGA